jgi:hypothetical protein
MQEILIAEKLHLYLCNSMWDKSRGVIGREHLLCDAVFFIPDCNWVHTFGLRSDICVYFLSKDCQTVITIDRLSPNKFSAWRAHAVHVLESSATCSSARIQEALLYLRKIYKAS